MTQQSKNALICQIVLATVTFSPSEIAFSESLMHGRTISQPLPRDRFLFEEVQSDVNNRDQISQKATDIIIRLLGVEPAKVAENASFIDDLGADSLDIVEIIMTTEEEFKIKISDEDAAKIETVGHLIGLIVSQLRR
jgi:acyl carrier protein